MKIKPIYLLTLATLLALSSSAQERYTTTTLKVFDNEHLNFSGEYAKKGLAPNEKGVIRIADGRVLLKKIALPKTRKYTEVKVKVTISSAGDRWDKSGSLFIIPSSSKINMLGIAGGQGQLPAFPIAEEKLPGVISAADYQPTVELMRFMTPFGVGYYSNHKDFAARRPVYIPFFEKQVVWEQDITDRLPLLNGEVMVGAWIDTWTAEGYNIDVELVVKESTLSKDPKQKQWLMPLVNTVYYAGQGIPDIFGRRDIEVEFELPKNVKNAQIKYIVTGHGGHSEGDEFVKKENIIYVDGKKALAFTPWRDDCASFRRFNPGSGVWLIKDTASYIDTTTGKYAKKEIEERLASSDISRSNWCPGTSVEPVTINLPTLAPGKHKVRFSIPKAQVTDGNKLNHWLVSSYVIGEIR
jgi:hypothetical protein